jgi:hypothetical protein
MIYCAYIKESNTLNSKVEIFTSVVKTAGKYFTINFQYFKRIATSFDKTYFHNVEIRWRWCISKLGSLFYERMVR